MILILVYCQDYQEAEKIGKDLVSTKLSACTNIIGSVHSFYRFKGKVEESDETLLIIKTLPSLHTKVIAKIKKIHSYEVPDILTIKVDKTTPQITRWLTSELKERNKTHIISKSY